MTYKDKDKRRLYAKTYREQHREAYNTYMREYMQRQRLIALCRKLRAAGIDCEQILLVEAEGHETSS